MNQYEKYYISKEITINGVVKGVKKNIVENAVMLYVCKPAVSGSYDHCYEHALNCVCIVKDKQMQNYIDSYSLKPETKPKEVPNMFQFAENYFERINGTYKNEFLDNIKVTGEFIKDDATGKYLIMVSDIVLYNSDNTLLPIISSLTGC